MQVWGATWILLFAHKDTVQDTEYSLPCGILTLRTIYWLKAQRGCFLG